MRNYLDILATVALAALLLAAMLWPIDRPPPAPGGGDKLVHLVAFAALAFPLARSGRVGPAHVLVAASAFGGLIELLQPSFGRSAELGDWVADIVGVAVGIGAGRVVRRGR
jgi:VanZ family protein